MNTPFGTIELPTGHVSQKKHGRQTFSPCVFSQISLAAASLSVAMTVATMDCSAAQSQNFPIFVGVEPVQNAMSVALGKDYDTQAKLLNKLNALKTSLQGNWNGEDDFPIEELAFNNAKVAISATPGSMLKYWRLFPNSNGTLLLSPKDKSIAGISIGNDEFSYAVYVSDDNQIGGKEPFSVVSFKAALAQIHRILGYV